MGNLKSAYEQEDEGIRLSPAMAIRYLQTGAISPARILSMLNVDDFHFMPRVDDRGIESDVETGFPCYNAPSTGVLACSYETFLRQKAAGQNSILVADREALVSGKMSEVDAAIVLCKDGVDDKDAVLQFAHFIANSWLYNSLLLDNPSNSKILWTKNRKGIHLENNKILYEGSPVTIDPSSGRIWDKALRILPPDQNVKSLTEAIQRMGMFENNNVQIAVNVLNKANYGIVSNLERSLHKKLCIGLQRTDFEKTINNIIGVSDSYFKIIGDGAVPFPKEGFFPFYCGSRDSFYRVPDLHNVDSDTLPGWIIDGLEKGEDHQVNTKLFKFRETFYSQYLTEMFLEESQYIGDNALNIIIPSVETAEEVRRFKEMVESAIPEEFKGKIKFGVMIETKKALDNIAEIAPLCDCLCVGTNDLTKELTGLDRSVLDYSEWMRERGYEGRSPFEVLVPEVYEPLAKALKIAREVNPGIFINACGHQVAGHDIGSIYRMLDMGVDQITVPPYEENFRRVELAVAVHAARNGLLYKPEAFCSSDLEV